MKGFELIAIERYEQIDKHGRTVEMDVKINDFYQLSEAAKYLTIPSVDGLEPDNFCPEGWDLDIWRKMFGKPYKERLIIAGALICAEIDRLTFVEN